MKMATCPAEESFGCDGILRPDTVAFLGLQRVQRQYLLTAAALLHL